uniref:Vacuole membrane protein 1 n=2 Tax=Physcomitrium patens TaxID=3218 RepID=A0A7I4B9E7_PHYPA
MTTGMIGATARNRSLMCIPCSTRVSMEVQADSTKVANDVDGIEDSKVVESEVEPLLNPDQSQDEIVDQPETSVENVERVMQLPQVVELKRSHTLQRERLVLSNQPLETVRLAVLSLLYQCRLLWIHVLSHHLRVVGAGILTVALIIVLAFIDGPHEYYLREAIAYFRFAVWWIGLGVASSIGLGSGLHTFVLYLGPHIAMFAMRASQCGRVDLKAMQYDTPQWGFPSSWQHKECSELGKPMFPRLPTDGMESYVVPILKVLLQVQLEAVLWGIGTAIGELPPYFVSRAARLSGEKVKELEDLVTIPEDQSHPSLYSRLKVWGLRRFAQLGFFAILLFASVPNPLFDLAGLMCGHFLVPFWKFFLATLIGKAVIKTHIQTLFVILACNPHVLEALEAGLAWVIHHLPLLNSFSPRIMAAVGTAREKLSGHAGASEAVKGGYSFGFLWNTVVQIMMLFFVASIITATAQGYLMEQQKREVTALVENLKKKKQEEELER